MREGRGCLQLSLDELPANVPPRGGEGFSLDFTHPRLQAPFEAHGLQ